MACSAKGEEVVLQAKGLVARSTENALNILKLVMSQAGETGNFWDERIHERL